MKILVRPTWVTSSLLLVALSLPVAASAQEQETPPAKTQTDAPPASDPAMPSPRAFPELDTDGDGNISKDEAAADPALTQAFGMLDQDADGKLTPAEYQGYKPAAPGQ
jgi:hypothetical protein